MVNFINKDTPITLFIPVDSSWVNKDYEEYFYLITSGEPERKTVMVRESSGQYYLQLTLEDAYSSYAIIRRRAPEFEIPGTSDHNVVPNISDANNSKETMVMGTRELLLIALALTAIALTLKVVRIQHKHNKKEEAL